MRFQANKQTYLDYASATPVSVEAVAATVSAMEMYANPGAIHRLGVAAKELLDSSREKIAHELGCKSREIIFVSGGTEANNLAILGVARKFALGGGDMANSHWIVSSMEHPSVLECFSEIERQGGTVSHIDPDEHGRISPDSAAKAVRPNTILVSVAWANHEIGTIQPLRVISRAIKLIQPSILLHSDAGQAPLFLHPQVHTLEIDLLSLDSGKLYGPRGIGALYVGSRAEITRVMHGGGQERGLRAGTENVALASGFAAAFAYCAEMRTEESRRLEKLRATFAKRIQELVPEVVINGDLDSAVPHMLNISIPHVQSEYVALSLDHEGISISTKSACREGEESRSHVVELLGGPPWRAAHTLRFSLGRETTLDDLEYVALELKKIVDRWKS